MTRYERRKEKIGKRIKEEREKRGLSPQKLLLQISKSDKSHKSVTGWEDGTRIPKLDTLVALADYFDCDVGYLLCDYDETRYYEADVSEKTGLSIEAVERIDNMNRRSTIPVEVLNSILTQPKTEEFLHKICELAQARNAQIRLSAKDTSSKREGEYGQGITANIAAQDIREIGDSKEYMVIKMFGHILDGVISELSSENPYVCKRGSEIAERALDTELNRMIRASYFKEDE